MNKLPLKCRILLISSRFINADLETELDIARAQDSALACQRVLAHARRENWLILHFFGDENSRISPMEGCTARRTELVARSFHEVGLLFEEDICQKDLKLANTFVCGIFPFKEYQMIHELLLRYGYNTQTIPNALMISDASRILALKDTI